MHYGQNMKRQPFPYLFIILLAFSLPALSSSPSEINISERKEVAFRYRPGSSDHLNNYFVKEIARYNFLNLYTTEYTIDFELQVSISENEQGAYTLQATVNNPTLRGDIYYRDFDLSGVLLPSEFEFGLLVKGEFRQTELSFGRMILGEENATALEQSALPGIKTPDFQVINIAFNYDDTDRREFEKRITEINRYLAYSEMLDLNLEKARLIHSETRDSILPVFVQIFDIERFNRQLNRMEPDFPVPGSYSQIMKENRKKLDSYQRRLNTLFSRNIDTLEPILDQRQLEAAAKMFIRLQKDYMEAMRNTSHHFEPAYLEVMNFFGDHSGWQHLAYRLQNDIVPEAMIYEDTEIIRDFAGILYQQYARECDTLIAREEFNEAELFATHAKTFCELLPGNDCEIVTFNRLSQTRYGIFDAYLRVAQSAMENQNLPFSYKYLKLARTFQEQNNRFIISHEAVDRSLEELAWAFLEQAESLYDVNDYPGALENYSMSGDIYRELAIHNYLDLIDKQISRCARKLEATIVNNE